jgi:hypothetical protein
MKVQYDLTSQTDNTETSVINLRDNIKQFNFKPAFNEQKRASIHIAKP